MHAAVTEALEVRQLLTVTPTFAAPTGYLTGNGPIAVIAVDLNGDQNLDFVTADSQSGTITIRRGRGDGTFRPATTINVGADPTDILAADFNKDGKMDLAVAVAGTNQVKVYLGAGDGVTFTPSATLAGGDMSVTPAVAYGTGAKLAVGDFDGDGNLDLVVTNPKAVKIATFLGQGNGQFGSAVFSSPQGFYIDGITAGDFNHDGKTDLAISQNSSVDILESTTGGNFVQTQLFGDDGNGNETGDLHPDDAHDIVAADLNGDGYLDLAFINGNEDSGRVLLGSATGTFTFNDTNDFGIGLNYDTDRGPNALVAADLNGDGVLDLAVTNLTDSTRAYIINNGNATWTTTETPTFFYSDGPVNTPPTVVPVDAIAAGDFNNDGKIDLLMATGEYASGSRDVNLFLNTTSGLQVFPPSVDTFTATYNSSANTITFNATASETNGSIAGVDFYIDGIAGVAGHGTLVSGTWQLTIDASSFSPGQYTAYAVANDTFAYSNYAATTVITSATPLPIINSFNANPGDTTIGSTLLLSATASESGGTITGVKFYADTDGVSGLNTATDTLLGSGTNNAGTWTLSTSTGNLPEGGTLLYAVATDGTTSATAESVVNLTANPAIINSFTITPGSAPVGSTLHLSAEASEAFGTISAITFYRDSDNSVVGSGTFSGGVWSLDISTAGLSAGSYTYLARATDGYGHSSGGGTAATVTLTPASGTAPSAPTNLSVIANNGNQVVVSWTDTSSNESGFEIERSSTFNFAAGTTTTFTAPANATSYTDNTTTPDGYYYYRVRAVNSVGGSAYTGSIKIKTPKTTSTTPTAPAAPTGLTGTANSPTQITLHWTDGSSDETNFVLQRSTSSSFTTVTTFTLAANTTSYVDTTVSPNTTYYYRMEATNSVGASAFAASSGISTPATSNAGPSNLTAAATSSTEIELQWTTNGNIDFDIQYSTSSTFANATSVQFQDGQVQTTDLRFIAQLQPSTTYYIRIRSGTEASPLSNWSNTATVTTFASGAVPTAPTNLTGTDGTGTIALNWTEPAGSITGYSIQRATTYNFVDPITFTGTGSATSFVDTTTAANTWYYYRVQVTNANGYSNFSASVKVKSGKTAGTGVTPTIPSNPINITAVANSGTQITVSWTDTSSNETGFVLQRSTNPSYTNATTFNLPADTTTYVDTSVSPNTQYFYRVASTNSAGTSPYAVTLNGVTTPASSGASSKQAAPTNFTATAATGGKVNLAWTPNATAATGYEIEVSSVFDFSTLVQDIIVPTADLASYTVTGLSTSTWYYFRVRAITTPVTFDSSFTSSIKVKTFAT